MSNRRLVPTALVTVVFLLQSVGQQIVHAEGDARPPQGQGETTTPLPNNLAATTTAQVDQNGLRSTTNVQIPVPGVSETRTDLVPDIRVRPRVTIPGGATRISVPPVDIPPSEITTQFPSGGANWIVGGGPTSCETIVGGATNCFGGTSIGGFGFSTTTPGTGAPGGQTTPWRVVGRVVQLDPHALALRVENELAFPPIVLKANPDPGLAQLDSWFWAANYDGGVRTRSGSQSEMHTQCRLNNGNLECVPVTNTITVDVRETPILYVWDFGDARTAEDGHSATFTSSTGLGRAYMDPYSPSPVLHKYVLSSLKFVDSGGYPIILRITWDADFRVNGGPWQDLGPVTGTFSSRHQVRESWPVGVNNTTTIGTAP
jgi:hypothetical protein